MRKIGMPTSSTTSRSSGASAQNACWRASRRRLDGLEGLAGVGGRPRVGLRDDGLRRRASGPARRSGRSPLCASCSATAATAAASRRRRPRQGAAARAGRCVTARTGRALRWAGISRRPWKSCSSDRDERREDGQDDAGQHEEELDPDHPAVDPDLALCVDRRGDVRPEPDEPHHGRRPRTRRTRTGRRRASRRDGCRRARSGAGRSGTPRSSERRSSAPTRVPRSRPMPTRLRAAA